MAKYITPIQPLIIENTGQKPTVPSPSTIMPTDNRFNNQSDLMVGQLAYNVPDDTWYYRANSGIRSLLTPTEVTVDQVEVWRSDKIYIAGNTYVSYINTNSSEVAFQSEAIYRCRTTTEVGESPEDSLYDVSDNPTGKWVYQGTSIVSDPTTIEETVYVEDVQIYDDDREDGYIAGEFVSYRNTGSSDPQFQEWAIYLANADVAQGVSPEDDTVNWIWQGTEIIDQVEYPTVRFYSRSGIATITDYKDGDICIDKDTGEFFKFNSNSLSTEGIKPINIDIGNKGRWITSVIFSREPRKELLEISSTNSITLIWNRNYNVSINPA